METSRLGSRRGGLLWLITIMTACFAMLQTQAQAQSAYPPTNRPWNPGDYRALQASIKSGKAKLPSLSDPATKAVFERMIAKDNTPLHVISIKGVPMAGAQILEISGVSDTLKSLIEVYAQQAPQSEIRCHGCRQIAALYVQAHGCGSRALGCNKARPAKGWQL